MTSDVRATEHHLLSCPGSTRGRSLHTRKRSGADRTATAAATAAKVSARRSRGSLSAEGERAVGCGGQEPEKPEIEIRPDEGGERQGRLERSEEPHLPFGRARQDEALEGEAEEAEPEKVEVSIRPRKTRRREGEAERGRSGAEVTRAEPPGEAERADSGEREREEDGEVVSEGKAGHGGDERCRKTERQAERVRAEARPLGRPELLRREEGLTVAHGSPHMPDVPEVLPGVASTDDAARPTDARPEEDECEGSRRKRDRQRMADRGPAGTLDGIHRLAECSGVVVA